jgi:hypothetical protein
MTYARRHWQTSDDAPARDGDARGAAAERARLIALASHVAKRRAVALVRGRRPMQGSVAPSVVSPACRSSRHAVAPWELLGARSMRDQGPRGTSRSPMTGRASSSDGAASAAMLPATHAPFGAARAGSSLCLPSIPGEGLCDEAQRTRDLAHASPGMPPQLRGVTGRRARVRSRTATSLMPTSSIAARTSTPMRLSHAAPGYLNPGTREGLAPITPEGEIACLD